MQTSALLLILVLLSPCLLSFSPLGHQLYACYFAHNYHIIPINNQQSKLNSVSLDECFRPKHQTPFYVSWLVGATTSQGLSNLRSDFASLEFSAGFYRYAEKVANTSNLIPTAFALGYGQAVVCDHGVLYHEGSYLSVARKRSSELYTNLLKAIDGWTYNVEIRPNGYVLRCPYVKNQGSTLTESLQLVRNYALTSPNGTSFNATNVPSLEEMKGIMQNIDEFADKEAIWLPLSEIGFEKELGKNDPCIPGSDYGLGSRHMVPSVDLCDDLGHKWAELSQSDIPYYEPRLVIQNAVTIMKDFYKLVNGTICNIP